MSGIHLVHGKERERVRDLPFYGGSRLPLIEAVLQGLQPGWVILNDQQDTQFCLVLNECGFGYLCASPDYGSALKLVQSVVVEQFCLPRYFHLYEFPEASLSDIDKTRFNFRLRDRIRLLHSSAREVPVPAESNMTVSGISNSDLKIENKLLEGLFGFWKSPENFFQNGGYGSLVKDKNDKLLSVCFSAASAAGLCEVDIMTSVGERSSGFGELVASHFLATSKAVGLDVSWDCFKDNIASHNLAKKVGFEELISYKFLSLFKVDS